MSNLVLVTALPVEARPLVRRLGLKQGQTNVRFNVFEGETGSLAVSGVGANASAAATSHLLTLAGSNSIAVNIGLAGCGDRCVDRGRLFLINRIADYSSDREFFPEIFFRHELSEASCVTYSKPVFKASTAPTEFIELIDMEASGFYQAASAFLPAHRILCLKTVSDHLDGGKLSVHQCESWIESAMDSILSTIDRATSVAEHEITGVSSEESDLIHGLAKVWRLTSTQKVQLENAVSKSKWSQGEFPEKELHDALQSKPSHKHERTELLNQLTKKLS